MEPLVSVLIPTNNRPHLLVKAVRSVLCQSYQSIEIIITDNSVDSEVNRNIHLIQDNRIVYVKNESNIGPILNWRKALEIAKGKYCVLLPDDDYFINPFYIEDAVKIAETNQIQLVIINCILGYPSRSVVGSSGGIGLIKGNAFIEGFWEKYSIPTIANLFERSKALELNAFHSNDILYSDIELWIKMMVGERPIYCYPYPSVYYLFHDDNIVMTMSKKALIDNSKFITYSLGEGISESTVRTMAERYIRFVDEIAHVGSFSFVKSVLEQNDLAGGSYILFTKLVLARLSRLLKMMARRALQRQT